MRQRLINTGEAKINSSLSTCFCVPRPPEGPDDYSYIIRYDVLPKDTSVGLMLARGGSVQRSLQRVPTGEKKVLSETSMCKQLWLVAPTKTSDRPSKVEVICVYLEGEGERGRTGGSHEGRVEVSCCINFSFRGKMFLPGEGTVCPGMTKRESSFPQYPSQLCVLAFNREQTHTGGEGKLSFIYLTLQNM